MPLSYLTTSLLFRSLSVGSRQEGKVVPISTRALLPFYKMDDVKQFCDIFAEADGGAQTDTTSFNISHFILHFSAFISFYSDKTFFIDLTNTFHCRKTEYITRPLLCSTSLSTSYSKHVHITPHVSYYSTLPSPLTTHSS